MNLYYEKYANLLTQYCLEVQPGERILIRSTYLAEPLLQELTKAIAKAGGTPFFDVAFAEQDNLWMNNAQDQALQQPNPFRKMAMEEFEGYLFIRAPFNLSEAAAIPAEKRKLAQEAAKDMMKTYMKRTADRSLKRSLCQFPTQASAQAAGMTLSDYQNFVFNATKVTAEDPIAEWKELGAYQQKIVDHLNKCTSIHYKGPDIDIRFSTEGRTWINSDGKTNMPSGEVYTAPVEDSVNGHIRFSHPSMYRGEQVEDIRLTVKDGEVVEWQAQRGQALLDEVFKIPGAKRFGEAAVGTNFGIQQFTKNILFDEKIGGTVHMAIGQAYGQCGGKNESSIHWDMIADMTNGGEIFADGEKVYENGRFII